MTIPKSLLNCLVCAACIAAACSSDAAATGAGESGGGAAEAPVRTASKIPPLDEHNIVNIAVGSKDHTTLVAALQAADYVTSVAASGPLTVFAPTNAAFDKVPADTLASLLEPENQADLKEILKYHVTTSVYEPSWFKDGQKLAMANGEKVAIAVADGKVRVNGANVVCSDVTTANATVHIIDAVLLPAMDDTGEMDGAAMGPSGPACSAVPADGEGSFDGMADDPAATAASNNPVLSTLVTAVSEAGLVDTLNGEGPFTIFAPTNDAFAAIPEDQLSAVLADVDLLTSILTYHVVAGESLTSADLVEAGSVTTVNGGDVTITDLDGALLVNGATSVCMDVTTANATVHIIDTVLLPES